MKSDNPHNQKRRAKAKGLSLDQYLILEKEIAEKKAQGFIYCTSCKEWTKDFGKAHSYCKQCYRDRSNANYDLEKQRSHNLKRKYGISLEEYDKMLVSQNHRCYICQTHENDLDRSLAVDHCHSTGKVRGLLCGNCNRFLGQIDDNAETVQRMLEYLNHHKNIQKNR